MSKEVKLLRNCRDLLSLLVSGVRPVTAEAINSTLNELQDYLNNMPPAMAPEAWLVKSGNEKRLTFTEPPALPQHLDDYSITEVIPLWTSPHQEFAERTAAVRTMASLGYKYCGGGMWKPPLGEPKSDEPKSDENNHWTPPISIEDELLRIKKEVDSGVREMFSVAMLSHRRYVSKLEFLESKFNKSNRIPSHVAGWAKGFNRLHKISEIHTVAVARVDRRWYVTLDDESMFSDETLEGALELANSFFENSEYKESQ